MSNTVSQWFRPWTKLTPEYPFKATPHRPDVQLPYPTTLLRLVWAVRQKSRIEHTASTCCLLHFCACLTAGGASLVPVIQNTKTGNDGTKSGNGVHRKTKCTQYWFSILPTREDVCGLNTWHTWKMTMARLTLALCALGLVMIRSRPSLPLLPHTRLIC